MQTVYKCQNKEITVFHFQVLHSTVVSPPPHRNLLSFKWCMKSSCSMEFFIFSHGEEMTSHKKRDLLTRCKGKHVHSDKSGSGVGCPESRVFSVLGDLKTRLNKTLSNMLWPDISPHLRQSNRTRKLSSFLPFWMIPRSDEVIIFLI